MSHEATEHKPRVCLFHDVAVAGEGWGDMVMFVSGLENQNARRESNSGSTKLSVLILTIIISLCFWIPELGTVLGLGTC